MTRGKLNLQVEELTGRHGILVVSLSVRGGLQRRLSQNEGLFEAVTDALMSSACAVVNPSFHRKIASYVDSHTIVCECLSGNCVCRATRYESITILNYELTEIQIEYTAQLTERIPATAVEDILAPSVMQVRRFATKALDETIRTVDGQQLVA